MHLKVNLVSVLYLILIFGLAHVFVPFDIFVVCSLDFVVLSCKETTAVVTHIYTVSNLGLILQSNTQFKTFIPAYSNVKENKEIQPNCK